MKCVYFKTSCFSQFMLEDGVSVFIDMNKSFDHHLDPDSLLEVSKSRELYVFGLIAVGFQIKIQKTLKAHERWKP